MQNDIENYLKTQKQKLESDKVRLKNDDNANVTENEILDTEIRNLSDTDNNSNNLILVKSPLKSVNPENHQLSAIDPRRIGDNSSSNYRNDKRNEQLTVDPYQFFDNVMKNQLTKADKDIVNENKADKTQLTSISGNKVDKEQWVSDVFYSYFPSLNNEKKKKHENLMGNQENENHLKKIAKEPSKATKKNSFTGIHDVTASRNLNEHNNRLTARSDKTEIEIIVNNPDFKLTSNQKNKIRPNSTRDKLLQDLKHTELSNMVYSNAVQERNRQIAEKEAQKKKEYQNELMRQIEEKRREIQILKDKEKHEEELLARKLDQQLRAMQLEKELENETLKLEKLQREINPTTDRQTKSENGKYHQPNDNNKVYKYFSNSARHDNYHSNNANSRRFNQSHNQHLEDTINSNYLNGGLSPQSPSPSLSSTLSYIYRNLCPFCNIQLKRNEENFNENEMNLCFNCYGKQYHHQMLSTCEHLKLNEIFNQMLCFECEKKTICKYCNLKRNLCNNCILNYCINCGKSIHSHNTTLISAAQLIPMTARSNNSSSRTTTTSVPTINTTSNLKPIDNRIRKTKELQQQQNTEKSFQILEISYPDDDGDDSEYNQEIKQQTPISTVNHTKNHKSNDNNEILLDKKIFIDSNFDDIKERTNNQLKKYLNNYGDLTGTTNSSSRGRSNSMGSSVSRKTRSTQTSVENTPRSQKQKQQQKQQEKMKSDTALSMPLLKEISRRNLKNSSNDNSPKGKSNVSYRSGLRSEGNNSEQMLMVSGKWEVPVVQKQKISKESPRVLTQLGAIRKQLQMEKHNLSN